MTLILTLASRNLFHDRVRLIATVVGIVFSIVLVTVQLGVFLSFERMVTTMIDHAPTDLWIAPADTKGFEATALLDGREPLREMLKVCMAAGRLAVDPFAGLASFVWAQTGSNMKSNIAAAARIFIDVSVAAS